MISFSIIYPIFLQICFNNMINTLVVKNGLLYTPHCYCFCEFIVLLMPHWILISMPSSIILKLTRFLDASYIKSHSSTKFRYGWNLEISRETFHDGENKLVSYNWREDILFTENWEIFSTRICFRWSTKIGRVYQNTKGLSGDLKMIRNSGSNRLDIQFLTFMELFKELTQLHHFLFSPNLFVLPFWCMDEQWYYSLFSSLLC